MASLPARRSPSSLGVALSILRSSLRHFRGFSTAAPTLRKNKNFFEVAHFLPNWGIGYHMAKTHWSNLSYEITKVNLYKDGKHGKAWGIAYKDGAPTADEPTEISGVNKRCWRYIPNSKKSVTKREKI